MKILLDECVPEQLSKILIGHDVVTMRQLGWLGYKNGQLLRMLASHSIEILVSVERGIPSQQNETTLVCPVIIVISTSNAVKVLKEIFKNRLMPFINNTDLEKKFYLI